MTKRKTKKKTMRTKRKRASTTRAIERIFDVARHPQPGDVVAGIGPRAEDLIFAANRPWPAAVDSAGSKMAVKR
jgi:hypothetical protein